MNRKNGILCFFLAILCLFVSSSVAESDMPYQEIPVNYTSIAFSTGTDPSIWWNSDEALQAAFALLVMLDIQAVIPGFNLATSDIYPSIGFGVITKEKTGMDGVAFVYLVDDKEGTYVPVTCDLSAQTVQIASNADVFFTEREAKFFMMAACGDNWKKISSESIHEAAVFLQEQFEALQK